MRNLESSEAILSTAQKLKYYQQKGYLFHGSPKDDIEELIPQKADDADKSQKFNIDTAIFASSEPVAPIVFGIFRWAYIPDELKDHSWSVGWYGDKPVASFPKAWRKYLENKSGNIYILPNQTFVQNEGGNQWKSKEPVKPIERLEVNWDDFYELGGEINWKE